MPMVTTLTAACLAYKAGMSARAGACNMDIERTGAEYAALALAESLVGVLVFSALFMLMQLDLLRVR